MKLVTERLELRSPAATDVPRLQRLYSDPAVLRYLPAMPPMTLEGATQSVVRRMKRESELGYAPFTIFRKETGEFIGSGGVQPVKDTSDVEIAYHFLPSAWGKGYATEAAIAILDSGFGAAKLSTIVGVAYVENVASWRILEKAGMRYVGLARYHGIDGLKKYVADRETWAAPRTRG